jgi:signal transduction histidine kinase
MQDVGTAVSRWWASAFGDVAHALFITAVVFFGSYGEAHPGNPADKKIGGHPVPHVPPAAFLLVAAAGLVLAGRRRWPVQVLVLCTAAVSAYSLLGYVNGAALVAPAVAVYSVATSVRPRRAIAWSAATLVVLLAVTAARNPGGPTAGGFYLIPALIAAPCFGGIAVASRRAFVASIADRAAHDARRQIDEERLRIARELHDVVAHTMATINVQAAAAAHVAADRPEAALQALQSIKAASKEGLRELRAILNVLRQADERDPTEPTHGVSRLDALIAGTCQAGLPATLAVRGEAHPLAPAVDLAAYRIVQESLTNALRHAGPATAEVTLDYAADELRIEITDTGRGQPGDRVGDAPGHGIAGMRERAGSIGGTLAAGPRPAGGFCVLARLPLGGTPGAAPGDRVVSADGGLP